MTMDVKLAETHDHLAGTVTVMEAANSTGPVWDLRVGTAVKVDALTVTR
jgi:hypothetical protein